MSDTVIKEAPKIIKSSFTCNACKEDHACTPYVDGSWTDFSPTFCRACERRYPASLLKAAVDPFDYALGLRTGETVFFYELRIDGDYVHLTYYDFGHAEPDHTLQFGKERGIDVRVDDIVWCCDAPYGS